MLGSGKNGGFSIGAAWFERERETGRGRWRRSTAWARPVAWLEPGVFSFFSSGVDGNKGEEKGLGFFSFFSWILALSVLITCYSKMRIGLLISLEIPFI